MSNFAKEFELALLAVDNEKAKEILEHALQEMPYMEALENIISAALEQIGLGWEEGDVALSQVYMSGRICEDLVDLILQKIDITPKRITPKMAIAVLDDFHILGKRVVSSIMKASGFNLIDYGTVNVDELVKKVINDNTKILLISTLMLPSALEIKTVSKKLKTNNIHTKIIVGGAPFIFDKELWKEVNADAMGKTASDALKIVKDYIGEPYK